MNESLFQALKLSIAIALFSSVLLLVFVPPLAFNISRIPKKWQLGLEFIFSLPLVFPPIILGFFLLIFFSPEGLIGRIYYRLFSETLAFSFWGVLAASFIYSFPHMYRQTRAAFDNTDTKLIDLARILGKSENKIFISVIIPQALPLILKSMVFCFSHIIGSFGVIVMVGGSIPGKTKLASIALFELVETFQYKEAFNYSIILIGISIVSHIIMEAISHFWVQNKKEGSSYVIS